MLFRSPEGLVAELAEKTNEANDLKNALRGDRVLVNDLESEIGNLTTKLASSDERAEYLNRRIKGLDSTIEGLKDDNKVLQGDLALANKGKDREETVTTDKFAGLSRWTWIAIGSANSLLIVGANAFSVDRKSVG